MSKLPRFSSVLFPPLPPPLTPTLFLSLPSLSLFHLCLLNSFSFFLPCFSPSVYLSLVPPLVSLSLFSLHFPTRTSDFFPISFQFRYVQFPPLRASFILEGCPLRLISILETLSLHITVSLSSFYFHTFPYSLSFPLRELKRALFSSTTCLRIISFISIPLLSFCFRSEHRIERKRTFHVRVVYGSRRTTSKYSKVLL